jgi:hypothetical protein
LFPSPLSEALENVFSVNVDVVVYCSQTGRLPDLFLGLSPYGEA